jgi:hypothetical protein
VKGEKMKRSFLEGLGIEDKETIDKILNENGKDLESAKQELTVQRDDYKSQLDKAQNTLKSFEGVDINELKGRISKLENDIATEKQNSEQRIADIQFDHLIMDTAKEFGAKDIEAVLPFVDKDKLKNSKNQEADIKAAFETVKKEKDYLFESEKPTEPIEGGVGPTTPPKRGLKTAEELDKMSYADYKAYRKNN